MTLPTFDPQAAQLAQAFGAAPAADDAVILIRWPAGTNDLAVKTTIPNLDQRALADIIGRVADDLRAGADNVAPSGIILPRLS